MPVANLKSRAVPPALRGVIACGPRGVPRYWLTIWLDGIRVHLSPTSKREATAAVERLYQTGASLRVDLDVALALVDMPGIRLAMSAHFQRLSNRARQKDVSGTRAWRYCVAFVEEIVTQIGVAGSYRWEEVQRALHEIATVHGSLRGFTAREPAPIRALPSIVVSELYEIFDPTTTRNPFRSLRDRYRNHLIFLLLLHLGLRRGEVLVITLDAFRSEFDYDKEREVTWLVVDYVELDTEDDDSPDPRSSAPSLKNNHARRLLPISEAIYAAQDTYAAGHRRSSAWPHLLISQKGRPLSLRRLNEIFSVASSTLSPAAKRALAFRGKNNVDPHDLRHTSVVRRFAGFREAGISHSEAVEKIRPFFGWNEESRMPSRYGRAYYETEYETVWQDNYDSYVDAIRRLEVGA